jgi:LacI family transcriptional regulator
MEKNTLKIGLASIAKLAGVSTSAVSLALQNRPGVSVETRERIVRIAKEQGYAPDARLTSLMAGVRDARSKELLPIAWLNTAWRKDAWQCYRFHTPVIEGARERARELGYRLDDIWCHEPGLTMKRLAKTLYQRGIEGVIVTFPARHLRLDWNHLVGVAIGATLLAPALHRIVPDLPFNLQLAVKSLKRLGYRRIGICLTPEIGSAAHNAVHALAQELHSSAGRTEKVPPLFHKPLTYYETIKLQDHGAAKKQAEMISWCRRYQPEVIIGHDDRLVSWARAGGLRVPEDVGIVHLAVDDDVLDWAGIHSRRREMGGTAVEWLVSMMQNRRFGLPKTPVDISIRGSWQNGRTVVRRTSGRTAATK